MLGIGTVDAIVLAIYLIGILAAKKIKGMSDFIMPRWFGKWMLTMHAFGSGTHSDQAVGVASKNYSSGLFWRKMTSAAAAQEIKQTGMIAHSLKGILLNLRLTDEAEIANILHERSEQEEWQEAIELVEKLKSSLQEIM